MEGWQGGTGDRGWWPGEGGMRTNQTECGRRTNQTESPPTCVKAVRTGLREYSQSFRCRLSVHRFVSSAKNGLAKSLPEVMIEVFILQFSSPQPGQSCIRETRRDTTRIEPVMEVPA